MEETIHRVLPAIQLFLRQWKKASEGEFFQHKGRMYYGWWKKSRIILK